MSSVIILVNGPTPLLGMGRPEMVSKAQSNDVGSPDDVTDCDKSSMILQEVFLANSSASLLARVCYCGCSKWPSDFL